MKKVTFLFSKYRNIFNENSYYNSGIRRKETKWLAIDRRWKERHKAAPHHPSTSTLKEHCPKKFDVFYVAEYLQHYQIFFFF